MPVFLKKFYLLLKIKTTIIGGFTVATGRSEKMSSALGYLKKQPGAIFFERKDKQS